MFAVRPPRLWNNLPEVLPLSISVSCFKSLLKTFSFFIHVLFLHSCILYCNVYHIDLFDKYSANKLYYYQDDMQGIKRQPAIDNIDNFTALTLVFACPHKVTKDKKKSPSEVYQL